MEIKDKTIALLIDSDNVSRDYYSILLDELSKFGRVTYRRLYGDFSKPKANGWKEALLEHSIEQVQQIAFSKGKNATDSLMIIDAMDILYKGKVDCFCFATSDSDFTSLAMRFRNDNIIVIGAGEEKTPESFRKACDRFISIDELLQAQSELTDLKEIHQNSEKIFKNKKSKDLKDIKKENSIELEFKEKLSNIIEIARQILLDQSEEEWVHFSAFMNEIFRKENGFNPKIYGHKNSSAASFFKSLKNEKGNEIFLLEKTENIDKIQLKKY